MKKMKKVVSLLSIIAIIMGVLCLSGCGKKKEEEKKPSIVGTWKIDTEEDIDFKYVFNEDGTGAYVYYNSKIEFRYEDNGDKVKIIFDGDSVENSLEYRIEGDILFIKERFNNEVRYKKQ